ncbi:MAG: FG-GAP-like repeat-containing protein, partial [Pirellulales bacterium]
LVEDLFESSLTNMVLQQVDTPDGATSTLSPGDLTGDLFDTVDLPADATIRYTIGATLAVPVDADSPLQTHQATVAGPAGTLESSLANNRTGGRNAVATSIYRGSGRFVDTGQELFGEKSAAGVLLGDLDGDGDLDAFVLVGGGYRVLLNDGAGTLVDTGQQLGADAAVLNAAVLGDVDGDGDLDAVVVNWRAASQLWLNDGRGRFTNSGQAFGTRWAGTDVALADLDGDGDLDLFFTNKSGPEAGNHVWLNDGFGRFVDTGQRLGSGNSMAVALDDLDGDGDVDALVANYDGVNRVWLNDGSGQFSHSGQEFGRRDSRDVQLADFDGDGDIDALVVQRTSTSKIWLNDGTGVFVLKTPNVGAAGNWSAALGDVDGDGDTDAYLAGEEANQVWLNDGAAGFHQVPAGLASSSVALGDLDGDGDLDALITGFRLERVLLNAETDLIVELLAGPAQTALVAGETLTYEFSVTNAGSQEVAGARMSGLISGPLANGVVSSVVASGGATTSLAPGPIAGRFTDTMDLPIGGQVLYTVSTTVVSPGAPHQAAESIASVSIIAQLPPGSIDANAADNTIVDNNLVAISASQGTGVLIDSGQALGDVASYAVALGDLDGDGDLDAIVGNQDNDGVNQVWLNEGGTLVDSGQALGDFATQSVALGDVDGDGDLDVLIGNRGYRPAPTTL